MVEYRIHSITPLVDASLKPASREEIMQPESQAILENWRAPHERRIHLLESVVHWLRQDLAKGGEAWNHEKESSLHRAVARLKWYVEYGGDPSGDAHAKKRALLALARQHRFEDLHTLASSPHPEVHVPALETIRDSFFSLLDVSLFTPGKPTEHLVDVATRLEREIPESKKHGDEARQLLAEIRQAMGKYVPPERMRPTKGFTV